MPPYLVDQANHVQDIWEANSISAAYTPHPCQPEGYTPCTNPVDCGSGDGDRYSGLCDKDGCDYNSCMFTVHRPILDYIS